MLGTKDFLFRVGTTIVSVLLIFGFVDQTQAKYLTPGVVNHQVVTLVADSLTSQLRADPYLSVRYFRIIPLYLQYTENNFPESDANMQFAMHNTVQKYMKFKKDGFVVHGQIKDIQEYDAYTIISLAGYSQAGFKSVQVLIDAPARSSLRRSNQLALSDIQIGEYISVQGFLFNTQTQLYLIPRQIQQKDSSKPECKPAGYRHELASDYARDFAVCIQPLEDEGQSCTSNTECAGKCLLYGDDTGQPACNGPNRTGREGDCLNIIRYGFVESICA